MNINNFIHELKKDLDKNDCIDYAGNGGKNEV